MKKKKRKLLWENILTPENSRSWVRSLQVSIACFPWSRSTGSSGIGFQGKHPIICMQSSVFTQLWMSAPNVKLLAASSVKSILIYIHVSLQVGELAFVTRAVERCVAVAKSPNPWEPIPRHWQIREGLRGKRPWPKQPIYRRQGNTLILIFYGIFTIFQFVDFPICCEYIYVFLESPWFTLCSFFYHLNSNMRDWMPGYFQIPLLVEGLLRN